MSHLACRVHNVMARKGRSTYWPIQFGPGQERMMVVFHDVYHPDDGTDPIVTDLLGGPILASKVDLDDLKLKHEGVHTVFILSWDKNSLLQSVSDFGLEALRVDVTP
jgi:hypothetical protein